MAKRSPVIIIGLDAFDPDTARGFAEEGHLPNLARLFETGSRCTVRNPFGLFVGAVWASFATGLRPDRHGFYCWNKIEIETYRHRLSSPRLGTHPAFWKEVADAGYRVAVVDVPHAQIEGALNGIQLAEWGCHDRHSGFRSWPPERAQAVADAFGLHPILGVPAITHQDFAPDDYVHRAGVLRTVEEERVLLDGLTEGATTKRRMLAELFAEEEWDLFLAVFGEAHALGHQAWHLHDRDHPRFDAARQEALGGDPVLGLYRDLDAGVGELLAASGPDATFCVLMSHGMGPHHDGVHLLDEILARLDAYDRVPGRVSPLEEMLAIGIRKVIPFLRGLAGRWAVPLAIRERIGRFVDERSFAGARSRQRYFLEPNNYVYGGIRLNLAGREPKGCVDPADFDSVCDRLEKDLLAIVNLNTGRAAIRSIIRSDRHHRRLPADTMPDLFVDWDRSAPIERVSSPKIGTIHMDYAGWRTGDHRDDGLLLIRGPDFPAGAEFEPLDVEDLPSSIAARLGVRLLDVDGLVVPWLAGTEKASGGHNAAAAML